jgi:two-component system nitrogen regulation response regulator GlnG
MPAEAQTRLLRVLQDGKYTSIGGRIPRLTNARIIAATHRDLRNLIAGGLFREDLYYRLNVVPIRVPPLRERLADIGDLCRHFLALAAKTGLPRKTLTPAAMALLEKHEWPGNVRELENLLRRLAAVEVEESIDADVIARELAAQDPMLTSSDAAVSLARWSVAEMVGSLVDTHLQARMGSTGEAELYEKILAEIERPLLERVMVDTAHNQVRAAEILGINRNTLRSKLRLRGIISKR